MSGKSLDNGGTDKGCDGFILDRTYNWPLARRERTIRQRREVLILC